MNPTVAPIPSRELGSVMAIYPVIPAVMTIKNATTIAAMRINFSSSFVTLVFFPFLTYIGSSIFVDIRYLYAGSFQCFVEAFFGFRFAF